MAFLTVFTLPKGFVDPHISLIQRNAAESWAALGDDVEVLLMGDDPGVAEIAAELGVTHVGDAATNEYGTPLLDWAFREAAARGSGERLCYVNADIILLGDFLAALRRLPASDHLAIGQRWDCDITEHIDFAHDGATLAGWARRAGKLDLGRGSDYFAYPRRTDFGLPAFAVGRPGWDNWMMGRALELRMPLIDITPVTTVIHQNHDYGHVAARSGADWEGPEADRNRELGGWLHRYLHSPSNATRVLTSSGLRRPMSPRHMRAKAEEFMALRPVAAPVRGLVRTVRDRAGQSHAAGSRQ
jgi:hypothetical protein